MQMMLKSDTYACKFSFMSDLVWHKQNICIAKHLITRRIRCTALFTAMNRGAWT